MEYRLKKYGCCWLLVFVWVFVSVPVFAGIWASGQESMYTKIEGPDNTFIKLNRDKVVAKSGNIYLVYDGNHKPFVAVDLQLKSHCQEDFRAFRTIVTAEDTKNIAIDGANRTESFTVEKIRVASIQELLQTCSSSGIDQYIHNAPVATELHCWEADSFMSGATDIKKHTENLTFPVAVHCSDVLPPGKEYARVTEGKWEYTCHETPNKDDAYWQKYRFVVEGTQSYKVVTSEPIGKPRCVRAYLSDNSNMDKVIGNAGQ